MHYKQFQQKLRKEILGYSVVLIGLITILLSGAIIIFNQASINVQMTESESTVFKLMETTLSEYDGELVKQQSELYYKFMKADADVRNVYSNFYTVNSEQEVKGELILIDPSMNIRFSSGSNDFEGEAFKHYISLVVSDLEIEEGVIQRVYRSFINANTQIDRGSCFKFRK